MELSRAERDDLFVIRLNSGIFSYPTVLNLSLTCLLYTSDAADE